MRISKTVIILVAVPIIALQWIQSRPDIEGKIKSTFSKKELLEHKFKTEQGEAKYDKSQQLDTKQFSEAKQTQASDNSQ